MPSITDASLAVKEYPNLFVSPYGNDGVIPLYSSVPLKSPVEGCLDCIVCGNSIVRQEVITQSGNGKNIISGGITISQIGILGTVFTNTYNTDWNDIRNWKDSFGHAATVLPTQDTAVVINGDILTNSGASPARCLSFTCSADIEISITCSQACTFYGGAFTDRDGNTSIIAPLVYFRDFSFCSGTIHGDVVFLDLAVMNGYVSGVGYVKIYGHVTFRDNSQANYGEVFGDVDVYSPAQNPIWLTSCSGTINYHGY